MKSGLHKPRGLYRSSMMGRRRFVHLLVLLATFLPLVPRLLSKQSGRDLSLHEADFYRPHRPGD